MPPPHRKSSRCDTAATEALKTLSKLKVLNELNGVRACACRLPGAAFGLSLILGAAWGGPPALGSDTAKPSSAELMYEAPATLAGAVYAKGSGQKTLLFRFKRQASRSGSTLNVSREFTRPDGRPAVRQHVVYNGDELVSFELEELQNGGRGSAKIRRDPGDPAKGVIRFEYTKDTASASKPKTNEEPLQKDTLVDDMIGPFIAAHWDALMKGERVKCRYLSVPRRETVGFTFVKESESTWQGQAVAMIKMEPTSVIIKALVDPVFFAIEKESRHRIRQYIGRTTPKIKAGSKWNDLDAETVYDWK